MLHSANKLAVIIRNQLTLSLSNLSLYHWAGTLALVIGQHFLEQLVKKGS